MPSQEAWGRGIERIFGACRLAGTPEPQIRLDARGFWFEFPFSEAYLDALASGEKPSKASGLATQEAILDRIWLEQLGDRLGEAEGRVLLLIRADSRISTRSLAASIGVSTTAIDKTLAKLKSRGVLHRVGPARGGRWEILETGHEKLGR